MKKKTSKWDRVFIEWVDSMKFKQPWWTFKEFEEDIDFEKLNLKLEGLKERLEI